MSAADKPGSTRREKKTPPEELRLAELAALDPGTERTRQITVLGEALAHKHFRVVAKAATLAGERGLRELVPPLLAAYPRFLTDPLNKDPRCFAKEAVVAALVALDATDVDFFLKGLRYEQHERVYRRPGDPPANSAINVRSGCAMGLVATGYSRAIAEVSVLLTDEMRQVRAGAARAISYGRQAEAEAVLRLKVHVGDRDPEVLGECFSGLLRAAPEENLAFVARFLSGDDANLCEFAALALGESRHAEALTHLRSAWKDIPGSKDFRAALIRAAGLHRTPAAFDWLIKIIQEGTETDAQVAVEALSIYERDARLAERVQAALAKRREQRRKDGPRPGDAAEDDENADT